MSRNDWIMIIVGLIAYQVYATVLVIKSDDFDDQVKQKQIIFIWLIPIVGAMLVRMRVHAALRERILKSDAVGGSGPDARMGAGPTAGTKAVPKPAPATEPPPGPPPGPK